MKIVNEKIGGPEKGLLLNNESMDRSTPTWIIKSRHAGEESCGRESRDDDHVRLFGGGVGS